MTRFEVVMAFPLFSPGEHEDVLDKEEEAPKAAKLAESPVLPEAIGFVVPDKLRRHIRFFQKKACRLPTDSVRVNVML